MATPGPSSVTFAVRGPISRDDLPGLCERVRAALAESGATLALCDVHDVEPNAVTVDALAQLQLTARRHGCQVRLRHASDELLDLIALMGLRDVVPESRLRVEPGGEPEEREDGLGIEEERDLDDRAG
jgi:ABC-type transporter Mla MlaB component